MERRIKEYLTSINLLLEQDYILENGVQKMYRQYDIMIEKLEQNKEI